MSNNLYWTNSTGDYVQPQESTGHPPGYIKTNNSAFDSILNGQNGIPITPAIEEVSKMIWGDSSSAKTFVQFVETMIRYQDENGSIISTTTSKKVYLDEDSAERIAFDAAEYAIAVIQERYDLMEVLTDRAWMPQVMMDDMTEYIIHILESEYDFSYASMSTTQDDMDKVLEAADTICAMIDWDYIYDELEECAHQPRTISEKLRDVGMSESDFL